MPGIELLLVYVCLYNYRLEFVNAAAAYIECGCCWLLLQEEEEEPLGGRCLVGTLPSLSNDVFWHLSFPVAKWEKR